MPHLVPALLLLLSTSLAPAPRQWTDTLRDVYVDGVLVRSGQTLISEAPRMIAYVPENGNAIVIDTKSHAATTVDRSLFTFAPDRTTATTSADLPSQSIATAVKPGDSTWLVEADGHSILIHPHQSHAGPMTESDRWDTAPVWRAIYDHYTPDAAAVAALKAETKPRRIKIAFATWCGDSKRAVPRLLKALHEAGNPKLRVELFGIGPEFLSPLETIRDDHLTNVPTIIVYDGPREFGRIVETPATAAVEGDLAALLNGTLPPHPGRYERTKKIASGRYELRNAHGAVTGTETFEIWNTKARGTLVHSVIEQGDDHIETFAALDEHRRPDFAEVTRTRGKNIVRTRCWESDGQWVAHARGDQSGIAEQHETMPTTMILPATVTLGWPLFDMGAVRPEPAVAYILTDGFLGHASGVSAAPTGFLRLRKPLRLRVTTGPKESYDIEVESALNLPTNVRFADGTERKRASLTGVLPRALPAADGQ